MIRKSQKKIRRFTDDVLPKELKNSIRRMAKDVTQEVVRKVLAQENHRSRFTDPSASKD